VRFEHHHQRDTTAAEGSDDGEVREARGARPRLEAEVVALLELPVAARVHHAQRADGRAAGESAREQVQHVHVVGARGITEPDPHLALEDLAPYPPHRGLVFARRDRLDQNLHWRPPFLPLFED
jgi:hypothetical protein